MRLLETPGGLGKGSGRAKEAESDFPPSTHNSDIAQTSPCYQHVALSLDYQECTKPGSTHVGIRCCRLQGALGGEEEGLGA